MAEQPDTLATALALAQLGWHVFELDHPALPECAGWHKASDPCDGQRGKHPACKWSEAATTDPKRITAMFAGRLRNIGIACGPSGLVVIDEDAAGELERFCAAVGQPVPDTLRVQTGKGFHYYLAAADGLVLGNREGAFTGYKVNVRGAGGYVVGPGSVHQSGVVYRAAHNPGVVPLPGFIVKAITGRAAADQSELFMDPPAWRDHSWWRDAEVIHHPHRHNALIAAAGYYRELGVSRVGAIPAIRDVWSRLARNEGDPPKTYTWEQALVRLDDVYTRYPAGHVEPATGGTDQPADPDQRIAFELDRLRVRHRAQQLLDAELRGNVDPPEMLTLRRRLARPRSPITWRIRDWQPAGSRVVLAAQFKAGKTTLVDNLVRSLVDGDDWLNRYQVKPVTGTMVVLDFEMGEDQLDDWLRDQHIRDDDRVLVIPMRGRAAAFDILDDRGRAQWAKVFRDARGGYLVVDPLRPILDALGLDEHRDAGRFFVAFDQLLVEAGIPDALIVHHMGHTGERSRGDSRIRDWPDVEWRLVRLDDDPASPRFLSAYGRDVERYESQLAYDPATRHLMLAGGSRADEQASRALRDILAELDKASEPLTGNAVEKALSESEHGRKAVRDGIKHGVRLGVISKRPRPGGGYFYTRLKVADMSDMPSPAESPKP